MRFRCLDKKNESIDFELKKLLYTRDFFDVKSMEEDIERMKKYGERLNKLGNYLEKTLLVKKDLNIIYNHITNGDLRLQNAIMLSQQMQKIDLDISIFPSFWLGLICLLLSSLCPIFLARKVRKLALHIRIIWQVLKRIFALLLIYLNIITLFKNILVYLHHSKNVFKAEMQKGA